MAIRVPTNMPEKRRPSSPNVKLLVSDGLGEVEGGPDEGRHYDVFDGRVLSCNLVLAF
jgi:hypothetical protein